MNLEPKLPSKLSRTATPLWFSKTNCILPPSHPNIPPNQLLARATPQWLSQIVNNNTSVIPPNQLLTPPLWLCPNQLEVYNSNACDSPEPTGNNSNDPEIIPNQLLTPPLWFCPNQLKVYHNTCEPQNQLVITAVTLQFSPNQLRINNSSACECDSPEPTVNPQHSLWFSRTSW